MKWLKEDVMVVVVGLMTEKKTSIAELRELNEKNTVKNVGLN